MTLVEYYRLNRNIFHLVFKLLGIIFTCVFALLMIVFAMDNKREPIDAVYLFILCFVLGNFLAFSFLSLAFSDGYNQVKSQIQLFSKIPSELRDSLGLKLFYKSMSSKYSFVELNITGYEDNSFIHFDYDRGQKLVWITIRNIMNDIEDFDRKKLEIDRKYQKDSVFLSGWGLKKEIKWKQWNNLTEEGVKDQIIQLYRISELEDLRVERMYYNIDW